MGVTPGQDGHIGGTVGMYRRESTSQAEPAAGRSSVYKSRMGLNKYHRTELGLVLQDYVMQRLVTERKGVVSGRDPQG